MTRSVLLLTLASGVAAAVVTQREGEGSGHIHVPARYLHLLPDYRHASRSEAPPTHPPESLHLFQGRAHVAKRQQPSVPSVSPPLDPESHKAFYGQDYPHDMKAKVGSDFDFNHPYPLVQDSGKFDSDYVKDENSDGGEWQTQMEYDHLRTEVQEAKAAAEKKRKAMESAQSDLDEAHRKFKEAELKAKHAQERADEASEDNATHATAAADTEADNSKKTKEAEAKVQEQMEDLERCRKELEEAKAKLKKLQDAQAAKNKANGTSNASDAEAAVAEQSAVDALEVAKKEAAEQEEKKTLVEKEKAEYEEANKHYQEEQAKAEQKEREVTKAAERLRALRNKQAAGVDSDENTAAKGKRACKCPEAQEHAGGSSEGAAGDSHDGCPPCPYGPAGAAVATTACPPGQSRGGRAAIPAAALLLLPVLA